MNKFIYFPVLLLALLAFLPLRNFFSMLAQRPSTLAAPAAPVEISWATLGQMGDFFGGHTAAFSGLASVAIILYFSLKQSKQQDEHFERQLAISKQTADLTSLANIYDHYGNDYGASGDTSDVLAYVARGHRRWAIRESFSIVDPEGALEEYRAAQVQADFNRLIGLLKNFASSDDAYRKVAELTSSLLLDKRLEKTMRIELWKIYELLREDPAQLITAGSDLSKRFNHEIARLSNNLGGHAPP